MTTHHIDPPTRPTAGADLHPSSVLYSGEVQDFCAAMDLYIQQMHHEIKAGIKKSLEWNGSLSLLSSELNEEMRGWALQANEAKVIYKKHMKDVVPAIIAELRAKGGVFADFADALESGDYTNLAI